MRFFRLAMLAVFAVVPGAVCAGAQPDASVPEWQTAAGGRQAFDVASVRENKDANAMASINVPYGPDPAFTPTGGTFKTQKWPLWQLMVFSFKLTTAQREQMVATLPDWAKEANYDINARSENVNATKDQLRLMMQSLLADRFGLKSHYEMRDVPVYDVVVAKTGVLGPGLRPHRAEDKCAPVVGREEAEGNRGELVDGRFPARCGSLVRMPPSQPYLRKEGCRNLPMAQIVGAFTGLGKLGRPAVDKTELAGTYDWVMEFVNENDGAQLPADADGMMFEEALRKQTGLKLASSKASLQFLVIDHIDRPSEN